MSYALSGALQSAVYQALAADTALATIVGSAIYDVVPTGSVPETYVSLGPETVRDASDKTGAGAEHRFVVSVVTEAAGFQTAKEAAAAISDRLANAALTLARGRLVSLRFEAARARRVQKSDARRIDITFRARVEDD